nr:protein suppressor of k(+) transport growth defect 1 [Quercus suber]
MEHNNWQAMLTSEQAQQLADKDLIVSVFQSKMNKLCTTHSWEFLGIDSEQQYNQMPMESTSNIIGVGHNDQKVLVLAAMNTPHALYKAIRRRFDKHIYIPLPEANACDTPHNLSESDFESLARKMEGFSGSDISVCVSVLHISFHPLISKTDFGKVLARQRPTVSKSDLDVHERFTKELGEEG